MRNRQEHACVATALIGADTLLRDGLVRILAGTSFRVSAAAPNVGELCFSPPENRPALVIVAEESPGGAVHHLRELRKAHPRACLALLAATCDLDHVKAASRAGANAYLFTAMTAEALVRSLELAISGHAVLPNAVLAALCDGSQPSRRKPEGTADALDDAGCRCPARCHAPRLCPCAA